jgi:hypothetical protein
MKEDKSIEKIARILRIDKEELVKLNNGLEQKTGKSGVLEKIAGENETLLRKSLDFLGLGRNVSAFELYDSLISKVESDDMKIFEALGRPNLEIPEQVQRVLDLARKLTDGYKGFFLKKDVAERLLRSEPPKQILKALGYKTVDAMLAKEDWLEIFSALRFLENPEWLNNVFFNQYKKLTPADFEERTITAKVLGKKWVRVAEKFVKKKYHNVSHLKELGVIFVIPKSLGVSGETLRLLALLLHYCHEIHFYSDLFRYFAKDKKTFSKNLIDLLKGYVSEYDLSDISVKKTRFPKFLVIQQYLGKIDENDWRLFFPHVNPESIHWQKAENNIVLIEKFLPKIKDGLHFWKDLDCVGDFFKDDVGREVLVSFNLVDIIMSLVMEKEMVKYLYHHQEALWNRIYSGYFGEKKLLNVIQKNISKGWFQV